MQNRLTITAAAFLAATIMWPATGQTIDPVFEQSSLYGIGMPGGKLWRYDFQANQLQQIGHVQLIDTGQTLVGIEASAYFPKFQQIHAFWTDNNDGLSKVVHIDTETAEAKLTGIDLGKGTVRGAVAVVGEALVNLPDGTQSMQTSWQVFALQDNPEPEYPPAAIGQLNLNPKNNQNYDFKMKMADGTMFTRDDIRNGNYTINEDGVVYEGKSEYIYIKPAGNGNQNALNINGDQYLLDNATELTIESTTMTVKLFNSKVNNGKSMGDWWLEIHAESATITDAGVVVLSPPEPWVPTSRIFALHTETGLGTTAMQLDNLYDGGLATNDGVVFYATRGNELWRIVPESMSETLVGTMSHNNMYGLEFVGETLMGFYLSDDKLVPIDVLSGAYLGTPTNVGGITDLGTITFLLNDEVPQKPKVAFD